MTNDEIKDFAKKIEILSCSNDRATLIKLGSVKGRIDEIFDRFKEKQNKIKN